MEYEVEDIWIFSTKLFHLAGKIKKAYVLNFYTAFTLHPCV